MKRIIAVLLAVLAITLVWNNETKNETQYLRLHIRAHSNSDECQAVKYEVKQVVENVLAGRLAAASTFDETMRIVRESQEYVEYAVNGYLIEIGAPYRATATLKREYFPTRTYEGVTLNEGEYDAFIVSLGSGEGDNWWCVLYPPLCYVKGRLTGEDGVTYKSKIVELWQAYFNKNKA